jgi:replicative DNA helicase
METDNQEKLDDVFNTAIQEKFLTLLIYNKDWAKGIGLDLIKAEYFENNILRKICQLIHDHYKNLKTSPSKDILEEDIRNYIDSTKALSTKDFFAYKEVIDRIYNIEADSNNLEWYKDKIVEFVRKITWKKALSKGEQCLDVGNYTEAIEKFKQVLNITADEDTGLDFETLDFDAFADNLSEVYDKTNMIHTGISAWDDALGGGFVKKNIHIIGAAPGAGKSRIMAYLAKRALMDLKKVIFFTLELSEEETMANIITSYSGLTISEIADKTRREEYKELSIAFREKYNADLAIKYYNPGAVSTDTLHNCIYKIIQMKERKGYKNWYPDVIFVDYLDKLLPTIKIKGSSYEDMGAVATDLKALAVAFNCPVITGSQLGKVTWTLTGDSVVGMSAIAESAQKVHLAHTMTTVNRNPAEKEQNKARLFLAKSRSGKPDTVVYINYDIGKCSFADSDPWDPNQLESIGNYTIKDTSAK